MISEEQVRQIINATLPGFDASVIDADEELSDAGIDSLDRVKILMEIEEVHGVMVADGDLDQCKTIRGIVDYCASRAASTP